MGASPLISIDAGSDILRAGLERVVNRAGLRLASGEDPGNILLRVQLDDASSPGPADDLEREIGYAAELLVSSDQLMLRLHRPVGVEMLVAVEKLLGQLTS